MYSLKKSHERRTTWISLTRFMGVLKVLSALATILLKFVKVLFSCIKKWWNNYIGLINVFVSDFNLILILNVTATFLEVVLLSFHCNFQLNQTWCCLEITIYSSQIWLKNIHCVQFRRNIFNKSPIRANKWCRVRKTNCKLIELFGEVLQKIDCFVWERFCMSLWMQWMIFSGFHRQLTNLLYLVSNMCQAVNLS